jgi:hypothetical protein
MSYPLDGCAAKITRADQSIIELKAEIDAFLKPNPYSLIPEDDPQAGQIVWRAKTIRGCPPEWSARIGEVVHDLRSALDHLAWQLVIANSETPDSKTEFPVFWDAVKYKAESPRKVRGISQQARAQIERLQPYQAADRFEDHLLYIVHQLNLTDKHRLLNVVGSSYRPQRFGMAGAVGTGTIHGITADGRPVPFEDGAEIMTFKYGVGNAPPNEISLEADLTFDVAFDGTGPGKGQPVVPLLTTASGAVWESIRGFLPFFPSLTAVPPSRG